MSAHKVNNFDLIRLLAATQVMVGHASVHLKLATDSWVSWSVENILRAFPGVPIFFTISGFLIYWSYERNYHALKRYIWNRLLRIYPAMWACFLVTVGLLLAFQILNTDNLFTHPVEVWCVTQIIGFQIYHPEFLRFGIGIPNGSLWTIPLELQFYFLVPLIFLAASRMRSRLGQNIVLVAITAVSVATNVYAQQLEPTSSLRTGLTVAPYLFFFMLGVLLYKNFDALERFLRQRFLYWIAAYGIYFLICNTWLALYKVEYWVNGFSLVGYALLAGATISLAYTMPGLSERLLHGNDISYGVYIYHMLIVNTLVELGYTGQAWYLVVCVAVTYVLAYASWTLIERRALARKERPAMTRAA